MKPIVKTFTFFIITTLLSSLLYLESCKKKTPDPPVVVPPTPTNYLCEGNGENNYFPLKTGNKWEYTEAGNSTNTTWEVNLTKVMGGKTFFEVKFKTAVDNLNYYYRHETNGDVNRYYEDDLKEYLYLPISPVAGQEVAVYNSGAKRKVISTTETLTIGSCTYTNLVKVVDLDPSGATLSTAYYKKGLGEVQADGLLQPRKLTKVTF